MKNIKMNLAGTKIVEKWKIWFLIPITIILIALVSFGIYAGINGDAAKGLNIGIDFTGGNIITLNYTADIDDATYKSHLEKIDDVLANYDTSASLNQKAGAKGIIIRYPLLANDDVATRDAVEADIEKAFSGELATNTEGEPDVLVEYIGPNASSTLVLTAFLSVLISTLLILLYIIARFRNVFTGFSAVIALIHDVLMVLCLTTIFNIQINSSFIAAIITVIAYSINNTIVLFDRVRENYKALPLGAPINHNYIVNKSISQTLSRSMITTITTMAAIVIFAIIGVSAIREFALPVIFGLIAGTFSSVFLAPSMYSQMRALDEKIKVSQKLNGGKRKKTLKKSKVKDNSQVS